MARKKTRIGETPDEAPFEDSPSSASEEPEVGSSEESVRPLSPPETDPPTATTSLAALAAPLAPLTAEPSPAIAHLQERIDRLESILAPLQQLDGLEERLFQRVTSYIERTRPEAAAPPPTHVAEPSILAKATAIGTVGKHLLTSMVMPAVSSAMSPGPGTTGRPPARPWAIREIFAELQAMFYMYVDPRYRLSWPGRIVPPVLLGLFLTTGWWAPYFFCGVGEILRKPIEILLCFSLIKLLSYEARRYRDTAPDLPSSLRL